MMITPETLQPPTAPPEIGELLYRGDRARALLAAPFFTEVMNALSNFHLAAMVACRPGHPEDAAAHTHHHTMLHAMREVVDELKGYVSAAEELSKHLFPAEGTDE